MFVWSVGRSVGWISAAPSGKTLFVYAQILDGVPYPTYKLEMIIHKSIIIASERLDIVPDQAACFRT